MAGTGPLGAEKQAIWHNNRAERGPSRRKRPWVRHIRRVYPTARVRHPGERLIAVIWTMALFRLKRWSRIAGVALPLLAMPALAAGVQAADSLYEVAKISVDVTAKDAVAARDEGMAEAQMRAP